VTAGELATRLNGRASGAGWVACCPAHDDRRASLSIGEGARGRTLLNCFANCGTDAIVSAMGLTMADLFDDKPAPATPIRPVTPQIVKTYDYCDEGGALAFQTVRYEPKDFRQRRPDGRGGWIWNLQGVGTLLYRLPELKGKAAVAICAGEKDADALWALGIPATTNALGEGRWRDEHTQQLVAAGAQRVEGREQSWP
jgi:putative DNA primase/helicase